MYRKGFSNISFDHAACIPSSITHVR